MITCTHRNALPAIVCAQSGLPKCHRPTLTEVASLAIYGAPLRPGRGDGTLREAMTPLQIEGRALWRNDNGPGYLVEHLNRISAGEPWPYKSDSVDNDERITLASFAAAERWLTRWRKAIPAEALPPELAKRVKALAAMSDAEAIQYAGSEADRIEQAEHAANRRAEAFYRVVSALVSRGQVELEAITVDRATGEWLAREPGSPPHTAIARQFFNLPMIHDLYDNQLDVDRFSSDSDLLDSLFNRVARSNDAKLVRWEDIRVSLDDARLLLSTFLYDRVRAMEIAPDAGEIEAAKLGLDPLNPSPDPNQLDPMKESRWTIPMALAWIVTRDPYKVRMQWDKWRGQVREWRRLVTPEPMPDGKTRGVEGLHLVPLSKRHGSYSDLNLDAALSTACGESFVVQPEDAKTALWHVLDAGKLDPDGIDPRQGKRVPIPPREFHDLGIFSSSAGKDYLSAGLGGQEYHDPTVSRADVVEHVWRQPAATSACKDLEPEKPGPEPLRDAIIEADRALWPEGPPKGMQAKVRRDRIRAHVKSQSIGSISDRTFQRYGIGKT